MQQLCKLHPTTLNHRPEGAQAAPKTNDKALIIKSSQ